MVAHDVGWEELLAHPEVTEAVTLRSRFGLMAFHGGLEAGTLEIAAMAAGTGGASLYIVDQPVDLRWHVPSARVDPAVSPALASFLHHVEAVVAVHGYGRPRPPHAVLVGGANRTLAGVVARALRARLDDVGVVDDLDAIPRRLRGVHPSNPVNRVAGGGVQLELPAGLRSSRRVDVANALSDVARRHQTGGGGSGGAGGPAGVRPRGRRSG